MDSDKLAQEMKTVITARQNTIHSIKTQSYIDHCTIGNYKPSDSEVVSPYKALSVMEEKGEICQVSVHLKSGLERIGFVSLNPLSTLNDYTNLVSVTLYSLNIEVQLYMCMYNCTSLLM